MFLLGEIFFRSLTPEMQTDMALDNFEMPESAHSVHKVEQVAVLNIVRFAVIQAHERSYLNNKAIHQHVQMSLASSGAFSALSINHTFIPPATCSTFDTYNIDPLY